MKKKAVTKVVALEISHVRGSVLSGGDKVLEEMATYFSPRVSLTVIIPKIAAWHWEKTGAKVWVLPKNIFDGHTNVFAIFIAYIDRIVRTIPILLRQKETTIVYCSTNIFPDVIPAFAAKVKNPKIFWVGRVHHIAAPPFERRGNLIVNFISYFTQAIALFCLKRADIVGVLNEELRQALAGKGFEQSKLVVLPAGIDAKKWKIVKSAKRFEAVFLGRLHPSKGIWDLIPVWKYVCQKLPESRLLVAGDGNPGVIEKLKKEAIKAGLEKNVKIAGAIEQKDVKSLLSQAKIFLFLDHEAGFGIAPLEAMSQGVPAVGWDLGLLGNIFKKGFFKVEPFDTGLYAKRLIHLLQYPEKLKGLSKEALEESKNHSWGPIAKNLERVIVGK